jgi:hypothetical protein
MKLPSFTVFKHLSEQPFLAAVSAAAVVHSSWSLSSYFAGLEPPIEADTGRWLIWIVPGFLLAFSIDVGLLSLSHHIRHGQRNWTKLIAFFVLSLAMAYSQFLYISAHLPMIALGAGVPDTMRASVQSVKDVAVWVLPALLPTALILYAFSDRPAAQAESTERSLSAGTSESALVAVEQPVAYPVACPDCNWTGTYATEESARSALRGHKGHCSRIKVLEPEEVRL